MKQKLLTSILLLLSVVAPFAAFADSFKVEPVNLEPGQPGKLTFVLENTQAFYGFQADVKLPAGLTAVTKSDGQLDFTLSDRANGGEYQVNSNTLQNGNLRMGAFSANKTAFTGTSGALLELNVTAASTYAGGDVVVSDIYFIDADNKDVTIANSTTTLGVLATGISLNKTALSLKVGQSDTLTGTIVPASTTDKTVNWKSSNPEVATVDAGGKVTAKGLGEAVITATCKCGAHSAECKVTVIPTPVEGLSVLDADQNPLANNANVAIHTGDQYNFTAVVTPADATDRTVKWTTNDPSVIKFVDDEGLIEALKAGDATVTAEIGEFSVTVNVNVTDPTVAVTGITLDQTTASINTKGTLQLKATVLPTDATSKNVGWSSSNSTIATVSSTGLVTALKAGEVTITASASGFKAECKVTITDIEVSSVTLNYNEATLEENQELQLTATVAPEDATYPEVSWISSDENVAAVTEDGKVLAHTAGTATITATAGKVSAECVITVKAPFVAVETIELDKTVASVEEGKSVQLNATVGPGNATDKSVTWTSDKAEVATVDANGLVTAVAPGTATITAKAGEKTATCTVTVTAKVIEVTGVTLDKTELSLTEGETATLTASVAPADATDKAVTWSTSDAAVATVADGVVTAVKAGTATITVTTANGKTASCAVTVAAKFVAVTGVTLDRTEATITEGKSITLTATVAPAEATEKTVTWSTSDAAVATVENGKVTAVAVGTATITATASGFTATCVVTVEEDRTVASEGGVKMTYVNMDDPDKAYGEIAAGETAQTGFNKISGGTVGFGNTTWSVDYIAYLQVDASAIQGNVTAATLTFEGSGSTDSKRAATYGVGYNSSVWSADMTYNTADKSITTVGAEATTSSKSATSFNKLSFDITEAIKHVDENGLVTILVYATNAAGGYIKNPAVSINWTSEPTYNVTFTETNGVEGVKISVEGTDATEGIALINGTYSFTATAPAYKNYNGQFTVAGADVDVKFAMTPKETWTYTVKNNVNDKVITGTCLENEPVKVDYSRYILAADGTVWMKAPCGGDKKMEYNYTFTPDADKYEVTLDYTATEMTNGVFFKEAEEIEGMTEVTGSNANIRCSNAAGGYAEEAVTIHTLPAGIYKVAMGVWGNKGATFTVKAADNTIVSAETTGSWYEKVSDDFILSTETALTFEGATDTKPLDYILITKTGEYVAATGIAISKEKAEIVKGETLQLTAEIAPENATDKGMVWTSSDEKVATVDETGLVTAVEGGEAVITVASAADANVKASCTVKVIVPVKSLTILNEDDQPLDSTHSLAMHTGDEYTLTEVVEPENATEQKVTWTSDNEAVAKIVDIVEEPHQVHIDAIGAGEATITATLAGFSTSFKVTVTDPEIPVTGIKLNVNTAEMKTGATLELTATIEPGNASSKEVKWTTSDGNIATVSTKGVVTAKKAGKVTITATANKLTATCEITITDIEVTEVTLNETEATLTEGETLTLEATVNPSDATDKTVTWSSSDETVATVVNGVVTAVKAGTATITAKAGEKTATCVITVEAAVIEVETIVLDKTEVTMAPGDILTLVATVTPADATDATVTWSSSDDLVASVDENGVVSAYTEGDAVITAKAGEKTATCAVKVSKTTAVEKIGFDPNGSVKVFDVNGFFVGDTMEGLQQGTYIVRQGNVAKKVIIR